jgi:hypothetical protein
MPISTPLDYIQVPGKVDILVAYPSAYSNLFKIGESENGIQIRKNPIYGRVSGDRYGGNEGPPIEQQFFGMTLEFELAMSRWDPIEIKKIERLGSLLTTAGKIPLTSVGALMMRDRSMRFLLYCNRDATLSVNMPCCLWDKPMTDGKGTKYATCGMGITANRTPEGHWAGVTYEGIVYDADTTGIT